QRLPPRASACRPGAPRGASPASGDARRAVSWAVAAIDALEGPLAAHAPVGSQDGAHRAPHAAQHEGITRAAVAKHGPQENEPVPANVTPGAQIVPSLTIISRAAAPRSLAHRRS